MNVKELIAQLSELDPESMVVVRGYEGGVNEAVDAMEVVVALNVNTAWYYGKHEKVDPMITYKLWDDYDQVIAVQIG